MPNSGRNKKRKIVEVFVPENVTIALDEMDTVYKSRHSLSFYDRAIVNGVFEEGCVRISDHWNYYKRGFIHCKTDNPEVKKRWQKCVYSDGIWKVIEHYPEDNRVYYKSAKMELMPITWL